ncbi:hypothetical protein, partial [Alteromonas sp. ASW11-130]|uniref:hypothetical protein n=1 Tax=Alteromonas sp. ASW11-130 TaxID=3015775 RepID=UPI00224195AE
SPHVRVAHRQTPIKRKGYPYGWPFFVFVGDTSEYYLVLGDSCRIFTICVVVRRIDLISRRLKQRTFLTPIRT